MHVDDIHASFDRLIALGATGFDPVTIERGEDWWSASGQRSVRQPDRSHPEPALGSAA